MLFFDCLQFGRAVCAEMDGEGSDTQASPEVTPASSENDLLANKSEDSLEEEEEEDDDDIDKMLNELATFQEVSLFLVFLSNLKLTIFPRIIAGGDYFFFHTKGADYLREAIISDIVQWKSYPKYFVLFSH